MLPTHTGYEEDTVLIVATHTIWSPHIFTQMFLFIIGLPRAQGDEFRNFSGTKKIINIEKAVYMQIFLHAAWKMATKIPNSVYIYGRPPTSPKLSSSHFKVKR